MPYPAFSRHMIMRLKFRIRQTVRNALQERCANYYEAFSDADMIQLTSGRFSG